jgi:hypothetical protein
MEAWREEIVAVAGELRALMQHFGVRPTARSRAGAVDVVPQLSMQSTKSSARPATTA